MFAGGYKTCNAMAYCLLINSFLRFIFAHVFIESCGFARTYFHNQYPGPGFAHFLPLVPGFGNQ